MLIKNLNAVINDLSGKPIQESETSLLTLRSAIVKALAFEHAPEQGRPQVSGEDRFKRWSIANKVQNAGESVELTAEEVALIKKQVGDAFLMVVVGPVWSLLEAGNAE
jgi:hypothetical protein